MPRFSANISMLFTERPMLDRFAAARDAGFRAVEIQFPYDHSPDELLAAKQKAKLEVAVINIPVGDMLSGGPGLASIPGREPLFRGVCEDARQYAEALKPKNVNILAGWPPVDLDREECTGALIANLRHAAEVFEPLHIKVVLEACNGRDRPNYFLQTTSQAMGVLERAGHANLGLQYDLYHMQIMEGDLTPTIAAVLPHIGHIQFADSPGRHEPGTGEINFPFVFKEIDRLGYKGFIGAEYVPTKRTEDTLGWLKPFL